MTNKKTCFVITGFGPRTDRETGRIIDPDKTYDVLIKPVFDELNLDCFRAIDLRHAGNLDKPMYAWVYKADIVVADVSTLTPNNLYELGVAHALRPGAVIVISEEGTKYPFESRHTPITTYANIGNKSSNPEIIRFRNTLKVQVQNILDNNNRDSPVYQELSQLIPPVLNDAENFRPGEIPQQQVRLSTLLRDAELAKNNNDFGLAIDGYRACLKLVPQNAFLKQRLALVTYKSGRPNLKKALEMAEQILVPLNPETSADKETLGLSGAINKRLYHETGKHRYLDKAMRFYSRAFYIGRDHYNGINYAYMLTLKASTQSDKNEALAYHIQGRRIREEVAEICHDLINQNNFKERGDQEWIYQSLTQAYLGLKQPEQARATIDKLSEVSKGPFDIDTFIEHNRKLMDNIRFVEEKLGLE